MAKCVICRRGLAFHPYPIEDEAQPCIRFEEFDKWLCTECVEKILTKRVYIHPNQILVR